MLATNAKSISSCLILMAPKTNPILALTQFWPYHLLPQKPLRMLRARASTNISPTSPALTTKCATNANDERHERWRSRRLVYRFPRIHDYPSQRRQHCRGCPYGLRSLPCPQGHPKRTRLRNNRWRRRWLCSIRKRRQQRATRTY